MTTANIKPTIGRAVWFRPGAAFLAANPLFTQFSPSQPMEARIVYVHHDHMVNLVVSDHVGCAWPVPSVHLLAGQYDPEQDAGMYACCEWMPYQKGQAAKTEAAEAKVLALDASEKACSGKCGTCASAADPTPPTSAVVLDPLMKMVEERANVAPRVTVEDIEAEIASEFYFTGADGVLGASEMGTRPASWTGWDQVTFCLLILRNHTKIIGINYGSIDPAQHDAQLGRKEARSDAVEQIWPLLGFRLRDTLARTSLDSVGKVVAE